MRIAIEITLVLMLVGSLFYAVDRSAVLQRANAKITALIEDRKAVAAEKEQIALELDEAKALLIKTRIQAISQKSTVEPLLHGGSLSVTPEITVGERGKKSYFFKHLMGRNGQLLAENAHFRELLGLSKFSFKTPHGIRYYDVNDLDPLVVSSLGFDVDTINRRVSEEFQQRQLLGEQMRFQQEMRNKAAAEVLMRERAMTELSKRESADRESRAKERLANAAEILATTPQQPPEVKVEVFNVPPQY